MCKYYGRGQLDVNQKTKQWIKMKWSRYRHDDIESPNVSMHFYEGFFFPHHSLSKQVQNKERASFTRSFLFNLISFNFFNFPIIFLQLWKRKEKKRTIFPFYFCFYYIQPLVFFFFSNLLNIHGWFSFANAIAIIDQTKVVRKIFLLLFFYFTFCL